MRSFACSRDGRANRGVIDFGCSAVGDPACDVTIAWTFCFGTNRNAFRERLALDDQTWARGRGWALWKALLTLLDTLRENRARADAGLRMGWRQSARDVIGDLLGGAEGRETSR